MVSIDVEDSRSAARSSISQSSHSRSGTSAPSAPSVPSKTLKVSNKVTENDFTPRTRRLAIASKSHIRTRIVYHEMGPFNPMSSRIGRLDFAWATVKEAANNSIDPQIKKAFKRASKDDGTKKSLLTFVSHVLSKV
jgi:hypothetical protein